MDQSSRFKYVLDNDEHTFYDLSPNGEIMNLSETEDMLNELWEENQQLKEKKSIFILEEYPFYEGGNIVMISENYDTVKEKMINLKKEFGYGYRIQKFEFDKEYSFRGGKTVDWLEIDYDGTLKVLKS